MGYWKKHQKPELEQLLCEFDELGWLIDDPPTYYRVRCPKPCGQHMRWIHLTPSGKNYSKNARSWLHRQSCTES